jgi:LysM repeat protein
MPIRRISRRQLLGGAVALGAGAFLLRRGRSRVHKAEANSQTKNHLAWVWQFSTDGGPDEIGAKLRDHDLGIILKTHDGETWMSEYDNSPYAVSGPVQVQVLAEYFEDAGVPFHTWCVVHGSDPEKEAQMVASVALSGARSIYLDVEPHEGFWRGTPADAVAYGAELRKLVPQANVILSIDPRPWVVKDTPMKEFAAFSDAIAPQNYWGVFDTPANYEKFTASGYPIPPDGVTPEFLLAVGQSLLTGYGLPLIEVGQGNTDDPGEWERFIDAAYATGVDFVTVWRYGVTTDAVFNVLRNRPAKQPPIPPAPVTYIVQSGDTLGFIAENFGTTVDDIMAANELSNPHFISIDQQLVIPGGVPQVTAVAGAQTVSLTTNGIVHTVRSGDTLYAIAGQYGVDVDAIIDANGISDPDYLSEGQTLQIP